MNNNQVGTGTCSAYSASPLPTVSGLIASGITNISAYPFTAVTTDELRKQSLKELTNYISSEEYINHVFDEELINICNMCISQDTQTSCTGFDLLARLDIKRYLYVQLMFAKIINLQEITNFHTRNFFRLLGSLNSATFFMHILYRADQVIKIIKEELYQLIDQEKGVKELENVIRYSNLHTYFTKTNIDLKNVSFLID
jgi:hypothetical protein